MICWCPATEDEKTPQTKNRKVVFNSWKLERCIYTIHPYFCFLLKTFLFNYTLLLVLLWLLLLMLLLLLEPQLFCVCVACWYQATEDECAAVAELRNDLLEYKDRRTEIGVSDIRIRRPQVCTTYSTDEDVRVGSHVCTWTCGGQRVLENTLNLFVGFIGGPYPLYVSCCIVLRSILFRFVLYYRFSLQKMLK